MATAALVISLISASFVAGTNAVTFIEAVKSAEHHTVSATKATGRATKKATVKMAHATVHVATLGRK
jgi:hypothetical protein